MASGRIEQQPHVDDVRARALFEEEKLRSEIRNQLNPPAKKPFIWEFLNSSFGLFLLSSVLITGVAKLYTDYHAGVEARAARYRELVQLATEFDYRTRALEYYLSRLSDPNLAREEQSGIGVLIWRTVVGDSQYQPTVPQFKTVHFIGIASNMRLIYPEVKSESIQKTLAWIENGKGSDWRYNPSELTERVRILRGYIDEVMKVYSENVVR